MIKRQVLIVMDDPETSQSIQVRLEHPTLEVDCAETLSRALESVIKKLYCLLIIDLQILHIDNAELVRIFRAAKHTPILAITDALETKKKIELFHAGVDVFLEKPVHADICAEQANRLISLYLESHEKLEKSSPIAFGTALIIAPSYRQVLVNGKPVDLTRREFDLLHFFAKHPPGQVFSRNQIYDSVWDSFYELGGDETVKVHIKTLRKKLSILGDGIIENVRGVGYRFVPPK